MNTYAHSDSPPPRLTTPGSVSTCESLAARDLYRRSIPDFVESPSDLLHLFLLMSDLRRTLAAVEELAARTAVSPSTVTTT